MAATMYNNSEKGRAPFSELFVHFENLFSWHNISRPIMPLGIFETECFTQIPFFTEMENPYECTITFNPTLYTVSSAWNEGLPLIYSEMIKWCEPTSIDYICFVLEYQKNKMVHLHLLISAEDKLPISFCSNVVKGLQRIAGRSTFKPVIDKESYITYISKDLATNYDKSNICHFKIYYR